MNSHLTHLYTQAHQYGITITYTNALPNGWRGAWNHHNHTIYLRNNLTTAQQIATLTHELIHAKRGDTGTQPEHVENKINELAACEIISPTEYEIAERVYGAHPNTLAAILGTTPTMVEAYQRVLARQSGAGWLSQDCLQ